MLFAATKNVEFVIRFLVFHISFPMFLLIMQLIVSLFILLLCVRADKKHGSSYVNKQVAFILVVQ